MVQARAARARPPAPAPTPAAKHPSNTPRTCRTLYQYRRAQAPRAAAGHGARGVAGRGRGLRDVRGRRRPAPCALSLPQGAHRRGHAGAGARVAHPPGPRRQAGERGGWRGSGRGLVGRGIEARARAAALGLDASRSDAGSRGVRGGRDSELQGPPPRRRGLSIPGPALPFSLARWCWSATTASWGP